MTNEIEEKKEFLKREEIRTMAKAIYRLREIEAQKERERVAALKLGETREKIRVPAERVPELSLPSKEVKEKEEVLIPQLFPKKPGPPKVFQKILIRAVFCFLFLLIIGFFGWFFGVRKPSAEEIIPPAEEILPEEEITKKPEILIPPSLISVSETEALEISKNEEIPEAIHRLITKDLAKGAFLRIAIKNLIQNRLASLEDLSQAFQVETQKEIFQKLKEDYTLAIYSQEQGKRIVFITKIEEAEGLNELLKDWEGKVAKEGVFLSGQKISTQVSYFKSASYQNVNFRYLTISKEDSGICYALFKDYFIFATSFESLKKTIEELKREEELSAWKVKVGQLFIVGFEGKEITPELEEFIKKYKPGGVLLLSKNIENREQLKNLISGLQEISLRETGLPLFIAVDQEGGVISRIGFLEEKTPQSEIKDPEVSYQIGLRRGGELKGLGVNLNLAPLLDTASSADFLFSRSFQRPASEIGELAKSLILGQKAAGVLTAVKHFPGYSGISFNPEEELGVRAEVPEISQFKKAMTASPELIMTSNVIYQEIDSSLPFTFSAKAIQYLKNNLGSEEILIISDDLDQNSLLKKFSLKEVVTKPVEAGVDILIFSGYRLGVEKGLDEFIKASENGGVSKEKIEIAFSRISQLKQRLLK